MQRLQVQGMHHVTIVGSTRQSAIDFWQGVLGMPFVLEQPNLGKADESHLYFDPGDGRLLTVFTSESRKDAARPAPREVGCVEHLAFNVSRATMSRVPDRLRERGIEFLERDRGFMDSIYLQDPKWAQGRTGLLQVRATRGVPGGRRADQGASAEGGAERSSHCRGTPRGCDRGADADTGSSVRVKRPDRPAEIGSTTPRPPARSHRPAATP